MEPFIDSLELTGKPMIALVAGLDPQLYRTEFLKPMHSFKRFFQLIKIFRMNIQRQSMVLFHMGEGPCFDRQNFLRIAGQFQRIFENIIFKD